MRTASRVRYTASVVAASVVLPIAICQFFIDVGQITFAIFVSSPLSGGLVAWAVRGRDRLIDTVLMRMLAWAVAGAVVAFYVALFEAASYGPPRLISAGLVCFSCVYISAVTGVAAGTRAVGAWDEE